jgi:O-antigen/teichoic acid export membrane protein
MFAHKIQQMFQSGADRKILTHTVLSFVYRGSGILANLMMVPLAFDMLDAEQYGVWLAIGAVITWFNFLDVGLGNGLRNLAAESLAIGDLDRIKKLFATSFWTIFMLVSVLILLVLVSFSAVPWQAIFNVKSVTHAELVAVMEYVSIGFLLGVLLRLTISLYLAHHVHSIQALVNCLVQVGSYFGVLYLVATGERSLLSYAQMLTWVPLVFLLTLSLYAFATRFRNYIPRIVNFEGQLVQPVLGLGVQFIVLQLMWMLITTTDSYWIAYWLTPEEVVPFSVSFKYFSIINIAFVLIMTPYWSSFTQAFTRGDQEWIRQAQLRIQKFVLGFMAIGFVLLAIAPWAIQYWMSGKIVTSWGLNLAMVTFSVLYMILGSKNYFLNGIGKLKVQMLVLIFTSILHIVLSYFIGVIWNGGVVGILWGTNISIFINVIVSSIQVKKINAGRANGIWNR